jgi:uncharacterized protein YndB with AHSA1/START domain
MDEATTLPTTDDYTRRIEFASSPSAVFEALTTLENLAGWWTKATGSGQVGGELRFLFADGIPAIFQVDEAMPVTRVQWSCVGYDHLPDWAGTVITFGLAPAGDGGCELNFRHRGLSPKLECFADCKDGWDHFLPSLRQFVDTGVGNPWKSEADLARREARRLRNG